MFFINRQKTMIPYRGKSILYTFCMSLFLLWTTACSVDNHPRADYSDEIVFDGSVDGNNATQNRNASLREEAETKAALSAEVLPIPELPGYYMHIYETPYIAEDIVQEIAATHGDMHDISDLQGPERQADSRNGAELRTVPTELKDITAFTAYGFKSAKGANNFTKAFGPVNCSKTPEGKWRPDQKQKWAGAAYDMKFFAVHGEKGSNFIRQTGSGDWPSYEVTLSEDYTTQPDFLAATTGVLAGNSKEPVKLAFKHKMSAVQILVDDVTPQGYDGIEPFLIENIELKDCATKATYNAATDSWSVSQKGSHTYRNINFIVDGKKSIGSPIFKSEFQKMHALYLIPQQTAGTEQLILACKSVGKDKFKTDFSKLSINLNKVLRNHQLKAGSTLTIKISPDGRAFKDNLQVNYPVRVFPAQGSSPNDRKFTFTVKSWRVYKDGSTYPLPWKSTFNYNNEKEYVDSPPGWIFDITREGPGSMVGNEGVGAMHINKEYLSRASDVMRSRPSVGTREKPFNLARGEQSYDDLGSTANCYVVDCPGWYCFPLVFGNGYVNGVENQYALYPKDVQGLWYGDNYTLKWASDDKSKRIEKAYIPAHYNKLYGLGSKDYNKYIEGIAVLEWQDFPGLVSYVHRAYFPDKTGVDREYIVFYVDKHTISEGNAVLSLKQFDLSKYIPSYDLENLWAKRFDDVPSVWSWHIWITDINLHELAEVRKTSGTDHNQILKKPLGYCHPYSVQSLPRRVNIKYTAGTQTVNVLIGQQAVPNAGASYGGNNLQYQFGNKNPYIGALGSGGGNAKTMYDGYGNEITLKIKDHSWGIAGEATVREMITWPTMFLTNSRKLLDMNNPWNWLASWYNTPRPSGQYDGGNYSHPVPPPTKNADGWINTAENIQKTIYDPTPVGFTVPTIDIFSGFVAYDISENGEEMLCYTGYDHGNITGHMSIPILGYRDYHTGNLINYKTCAVYWCSETHHKWHDRPFYFYAGWDPAKQSGTIEMWQYLPPNAHWDFPHCGDAAGIIPQIQKYKKGYAAIQVMPYKR